MKTGQPLPPDALYWHCNPDQFAFDTTAELPDFEGMLGQDRAVEAVRFGVNPATKGYNLFVLGPSGTGRHSFIRQFIEQTAADRAVPSDWCYVNNFEHPQQPIAIELPAGSADRLAKDINKLIAEIQRAIPKAFESDDYHNQRQAIEAEVQEKQKEAFEKVRQHALERGIDILETETGFVFQPLHKGKVVSPKEYKKLSEEERERWQRESDELEVELKRMLRAIPRIVRQVREKVQQLDRDVALFAVDSLMDEIVEKYADHSKVTEYLNNLKLDVVDNIELFLKSPEEDLQSVVHLLNGQPLSESSRGTPTKRRYAVNVLVDRRNLKGVPVVFEDSPTYPALVGRIEHISRIGTLVTDFTLIRAGALHRANGGYLVLDALKVLTHPFAWEALKQALDSGEIRIKSLEDAYGLVSTLSLEPEPIPLDVKVVLIGDRQLYYLLQAYDPEFDELFEIAADFDDRMERSPENIRNLAQLLGTQARKRQLLPLDRTGVARTIEEGARHAGDAERLSTQIRYLLDILREAHFWATESGKAAIDAQSVQQAIDAGIRRSSRIRDRLQEEILRDTIAIDTAGEQVGQINGLSVVPLGQFWFGHPNRITARVTLGTGKVIDIEREVELGGPIHSKGVLILSGFLAAHYVRDRPLSLSASLVFEQSYGGVEGDSASAAELCALLSAVSELPLKQSLAITGSVNQHGTIQAIGGVNEKIEGFFDICKARQLRGDQGVLIPAANVKHLMLRRDVIDAVSAGQFHIYPVKTIDECMELLTGREAGERDTDGQFPPETVNGQIYQHLVEFAERRRSFTSQSKQSDE